MFDHTSLLRFLPTRLGAEVPNLSDRRGSVTGDLTTAFDFAGPDRSVPNLPATPLADPGILSCASALAGEPCPVPPNAGVPSREPGAPASSPDAPRGVV